MARLKDVDNWAFAREGLINENGRKADVISIEIWSRGSRKQVRLIQRFEPFRVRKNFKLIGEPEVSVDEVIQDRAHAQTILETLRKGVAQHSKVAPLWDNWKR